MKILLLSHKFHPEFGGIEVNSEMLANAFYRAGHEVKVMTWTIDPNHTAFPYPVTRNPGFSTLLKENRWADVVFENNPCLRLGWPAILFRRPTLIALCTWINRGESKMSLQDRLKLLWLKRASRVIAVSEAVRKKCWPPAVVISNPYRHELFRVLPGIAKNKAFVFLGRLVTDKGADIAIQALSELTRTEPGTAKSQLTIIGDGPELESLKKLSLYLDIAGQVDFTGSMKGEPLVNCLNEHKYLLVPSTWEEPFGNVALEGMACGCIPIVSDGGGLPDAIGNAGIIFKRGNVAALVECMREIQCNPVREQLLQEAAIQHLADHRLEAIAKLYLKVLEEAVI